MSEGRGPPNRGGLDKWTRAETGGSDQGVAHGRNACELARRLKALHGARGYEVSDCAIFPLQNHNISVWPATGRAVSFALPHYSVPPCPDALFD